jgi:hypothetical protein
VVAVVEKKPPSKVRQTTEGSENSESEVSGADSDEEDENEHDESQILAKKEKPPKP